MEYNIEEILEMYEDDFNPGPRPMAQEPRNMYAGGQLVRNTNNGSRPGYAGKPYLDQAKFIEEFTKQRIEGNKTTAEFVEYLNNNYKPSAQTDKFKIGNVDRRMRILQEKGLIPKDIVTKGSKANLALTPEKYISLLGEEGYAAVKDNPTLLKSRYEYAREKKNNPNFLEQRKIRRQNWINSLSPEEYEEKITKPARIKNAERRGNFPKFTVDRNNSKSLAWKDLVSRTYGTQSDIRGKPYFTFETPLEEGKNYNTADMKKIVLIDSKGNKFRYDTLFDDVKKVAGEKEGNMFKNTYDQRAFMNKDGITTELNKLYGNQPGSFKSVFNIQHIEGFNQNPFKIHMTFADQNFKENSARRTFTSEFGKADTYSKKKAAVNNYYKSLGPEIVAQIGKKPKGVAKPLMELLKKTGIKLTDRQVTGATALDEVMKTIKEANPELAKKVEIRLNGGLPLDDIMSELKKIPGLEKTAKGLAKGFMKVGGPLEVGFVGLDMFNELSKGKTGKQAFKTAVSNLTFGAYEGGKREDMRTLLETAKNLNIDSTGFSELKELMDLEKNLLTEKGNLQKTFQYGMDERSVKKYEDLINKLQNEFDSKSIALQGKLDVNSLVDNYTKTTKSLAEQQFEKSKDSRSKRVYPEMGSMGSDFMATIMNPIQSFLPQNLMETTNVTRPYVRALRKIPGIGSFFDPTSDAAILSATSQADRNERVEKAKPNIISESQSINYANGGIANLMKKYYD